MGNVMSGREGRFAALRLDIIPFAVAAWWSFCSLVW